MNHRKEEKKEWIIDCAINNQDVFIDITSEEFVEAYVEKFDPPDVLWQWYGAPTVPELKKLLAELYKEGKMSRYRHYCDIWKDGFPRWFYIYKYTGTDRRF